MAHVQLVSLTTLEPYNVKIANLISTRIRQINCCPAILALKDTQLMVQLELQA